MFNFSDKKHTLHSVKWIVICILALVFVTFGWWGGDRLISIVTLVMVYMAMAQVWNLLSGFAGLTSLGHQAFFGIGGYVLALCGQKFKISIWWSFIIAIVICVVFALIISVPIFKMSGVYFTIGTWIVAEALCTLFLNWGFVNYGIGYTISAALKVPIWLLLRRNFRKDPSVRQGSAVCHQRGCQAHCHRHAEAGSGDSQDCQSRRI